MSRLVKCDVCGVIIKKYHFSPLFIHKEIQKNGETHKLNIEVSCNNKKVISANGESNNGADVCPECLMKFMKNLGE